VFYASQSTQGRVTLDTTTVPPASTGAAGSKAKKPSLLINRDYALLFSGQAVSIIGDMLFNTTLTIWIATQLAAGQSWAPLAVSGVLLGASVPTLLIGPLAGVFVDRADRRRMMLVTDGLRAIVIALMVLISGDIALPFIAAGQLSPFWTLGVIYGVVFIVNAAEQFFRPSATAMIQTVVPEAEQPKAIGLMQASFSLAMVLGPAIAAPVFVTFGPMWALLFNALSFAISYLTIYAIRASGAAASHGEKRRASFLHEFWEGVRFYFSSRVLVTLLVAIIVGVSGASALNALDVFFTTENLGASTVVYGFVGAVYGLGAIIGSILLAMAANRIGLARLLWVSMTLMGVIVIVLSRMTSIAPALALMLAIGFLNAGLNVAASPLMMRETPPELMGRVMSIFQPVMNLAILASTALIGYLASVTLRDFHMTWEGMRFGPIDTIWLGGGVLMALSGLVILAGLWGVDRQRSMAPAMAEPPAQAPGVAPEPREVKTPVA
jgi:MFS family permease